MEGVKEKSEQRATTQQVSGGGGRSYGRFYGRSYGRKQAGALASKAMVGL